MSRANDWSADDFLSRNHESNGSRTAPTLNPGSDDGRRVSAPKAGKYAVDETKPGGAVVVSNTKGGYNSNNSGDQQFKTAFNAKKADPSDDVPRFPGSDLETFFGDPADGGVNGAVFNAALMLYLKLAGIAALISIPSLLMIYVLSLETWVFYDRGSTNYFDNQRFFDMLATFVIVGLVGFNMIQFVAMFGWSQWRSTKYFLCTFGGLGFALGLLFILKSSMPTFWFYELDGWVICTVWAPLAFCLGYFGFANNEERASERMKLAKHIFLTEAWVLTVSVLYVIFIFPFYYRLDNTDYMILWTVMVQPLYFEYLTLIPLRILTARLMKEPNCMMCLIIVHIQTHVTATGRFMLIPINKPVYASLALSNIKTTSMMMCLRSMTRTSCCMRDESVYKSFAGKKPKVADTQPRSSVEAVEEAQRPLKRNYVRCVYVLSEITLELAIAPIMAVAGWYFFPHSLFFRLPMLYDRSTFEDCASFVLIYFIVSIVVDVPSLYIALRHLGYPLLTVMNDIAKNKYRFVLFLAWSLTFMGTLYVIYFSAQAPDVAWCKSTDTCTCYKNLISAYLCP